MTQNFRPLQPSVKRNWIHFTGQKSGLETTPLTSMDQSDLVFGLQTEFMRRYEYIGLHVS